MQILRLKVSLLQVQERRMVCTVCTVCTVAKRSDKFNLWHRRLGHLGVNNMFLLKDMVMGLDFDKSEGKQTRLPFKGTGNSRAK
jgi:hypothetical protein